MISAEDSDLYVATCLTCNATKTYFTAQGANFFKLNHEGHNVQVKEPRPAESAETEAPQAPVEQLPPQAVVEEAVEKQEPEPVKLGNLVVDAVDDGERRAVKVYGIAGGLERFSKEFGMNQLDELNGFLESGLYVDDDGGTRYTWTPDKVDLSADVAKMIDEPPEAPQHAEQPAVPEPAPSQVKEKPETPVALPERAVPPQPSEEALLGKRSYIQEGEEYRQESIRVSKVLRKFRWNVEPPYVIGTMFDDLMCVQSQIGLIKSALIEEVKKLGYAFVAIEAPAGVVTAWFKKEDPESRKDDEVLEFHR